MFDEFAEVVVALTYTEYPNVKFPLDFHMGNFESLGMYFSYISWNVVEDKFFQ